MRIPCKLSWCDRPVLALGLCNMHYQREKRRPKHSVPLTGDLTIKSIPSTTNYIACANGYIFRKSKTRKHFGGGTVTMRGGWCRLNELTTYKQIQIDGKPKLVHRLIAEAFLPNPDNLPQVNHIDGNKKNNILSNLEWISRVGNMHHAAKLGLVRIYKGDERGSVTKIKDKDIPVVADLHKKGMSYSQIAKKYNVHKATIYKVINGRGKSWAK